MNGVTTMARGLVTLHARGEELDDVPMSIQDLIGVASYHFRKSHLGCLQTVRSHPEISEDLLVNMIAWNNMLMRLFKTRDKLAEKPSLRTVDAGSAGIQKEPAPLPSGSDAGSLPAAKAGTAGFDPFQAFGPETRGVTEPAAISGPGSFTAPRSFSSYDGKLSTRSAELPSGERKPAAVEARNAETNGKQRSAAAEAKTSDGEREQTTAPRNPEDRRADPSGAAGTEKAQPQPSRRTLFKKKNEGTPEPSDPPEEAETPGAPDRPLPEKPLRKPEGAASEDPLPDDPPPDDAMPPYLKILRDVYARSGPSEKGELTFTFDELCDLAGDPDFHRLYPEAAKDIVRVLEEYRTG